MILKIQTDKERAKIEKGLKTQHLLLEEDALSVGSSFGFVLYDKEKETFSPCPFGRSRSKPFGSETVSSVSEVTLLYSSKYQNLIKVFVNRQQLTSKELTEFCKREGLNGHTELRSRFFSLRYGLRDKERTLRLKAVSW